MPVSDPAKPLLALAREWYSAINIVVSTADERVKLPQKLNGNVVLRIEPNNPPNNLSFEMTNEGFSCVMSFNREPFNIFVPFGAMLHLLTDDYAIHFRSSEEREAPEPATEHEDDPIMKPRAKLRGIDGGKK